MLMFLFSDIPNTCHLLLGLLFLIATHWTIQTIKEFWVPGSKKKLKNCLAPCLTSLQGSRDKGTDPERSSDDLNLQYTLRTLDRNIQYLAWQMQRITGPTARSSPSNTSVETVISVHSQAHSSAGSRSRTPPSPAPVSLTRDVQDGQQQLIRPPGAGFQKVRVEALSHRKVDFNIRQKQLKEQWGGPTPHSESLTRLIPSAPTFHRATKGTDPSMQIRAARVLSYKEQELLNWHVQKKHQQKETPILHLAPVAARAPINDEKMQAGETMHWMIQQSPAAQWSRSHTPPQSITYGRHTPPRSPHKQSIEPFAWTPIPLPAPEERPPSPRHICKSESHSKVSESVKVKVSSGTPKEELAEMLTMLGQSKSPTLRESGRPGTPKEKEKDRHSPGRRPGSPKADHSSPKDKKAEVKITLKKDHTMHTLSWTNMPEIQKPSPTQQPPVAAQPKFLDSSFMCQNQLELPCIVAARGQQNQKSYTFAEPHPHAPAGSPKSQCLAHTIIQSLDAEQAMRDLQMHLAKGLETGQSEPSVEYPICLLCGRCTPYCPHPRTRYSPSLLVYPRLDVRDGEAYMTLGFLLKIKRSEADEWGLTQGRDVLQTSRSKERPAKKEKGKRATPRRRSQQLAAGPRTPDRTPPVVRRLFPETDDRNTRGPVATPQTSRFATSTPAPATPQTPHPSPARPPRSPARPPATPARAPATPARPPPTPAKPPPTPTKPPPTPAKPPSTPAGQTLPKGPEKPPSILKQIVASIKRFWARARREAEKCPEKCSEKFSPKKSPPSQKPGTPLSAPVSPEPHKANMALSLPSPTSGSQAKDISKISKQEASPSKSATPQTPPKPGTPATKQAMSSKRTSPRDRKRLSLQFKEPDSPFVPKKGASSLKKSASPRTPRKSPSVLRKTPS
ncbi:uncharacterized protein LOC143834250 [Paroedura picta]|uniref:uncharacterized protein LOC143834250 n=1 Tax=Paroedura picta TaxID=143630 RepID=UPI004056AE3F